MTGPFTPLRFLGETKVQIQFATAGGHDTQALGLMGLNGALAAAVIAAKDILEHLWWTSLIGLLGSTVICVLVLSRTKMQTGMDIAVIFPTARDHNEQWMDQEATKTLADAKTQNEGVLKTKRRLVGAAITVLAVTLIWAGFAAAEIS